jgi:hypothetical protein
MTDEQPKVGKKQSIIEGTLAQALGMNMAGLFVIYQASHGHYYQAGFEVYLGGTAGIILYIAFKSLRK